MNKTSKAIVLLLFPALALGQNSISGTVTDKDSGQPLVGVNVVVEGTTMGAATGSDGSYTVSGVSDGSYTVTAKYIGYADQSASVTVSGSSVTANFQLESAAINMGMVDVLASRNYESLGMSGSQFTSEELELRLGSRGMPQALSTLPNVFVEQNGGGYDDENVWVRGFSDNYTSYLINGVPMNDMENGNLYFSNWGVLADVNTDIEVQRGQSAVNIATPSVGGTVNFISGGAPREAGGRFKMTLGGDGYLKTVLNANSGLIMDGKGSITMMLARRQADKYAGIEGTFSRAYSYYLNANYAPSEDQRFEFIMLGSPQRHGVNYFYQTKETYDKNGRYYNALHNEVSGSNWSKIGTKVQLPDWMPGSGWNNTEGERIADKSITQRTNMFHKPIMQLNHSLKLADNMTLLTAAYYSGGEGGGTRYRGSRKYTADGRADWDAVIQANTTAGMSSAGQALGLSGNLSGAIQATSRNNQYTYGLMPRLITDVNDQLEVTVGLDWRTAKIEHYREVYSLLGGDYYYNTSNKNLSGADNYKQVGDKIEYYDINTVDWTGFYGQAVYTAGPLSAFAVFSSTSAKFSNEDQFVAGKAKIESDPQSGNQLKLGGSYNLSDALTVFGNFGLTTLTPAMDKVVDEDYGTLNVDYKPEKANFFDVGAKFRQMNGMLTGGINYYVVDWKDRAIRRGVQDPSTPDAFVNITGLNQSHSGLEYTIAYKPMEMLRFDLRGHMSNWEYTDNVAAKYRADRTGSTAETEYNLYIKGLKVGGAPQTQMAFLTTVYPLKNAFVSLEVEQRDNYYGDFSPTRRTNVADEGRQAYKLDALMLMNLHAAYSLNALDRDFRLGLNVSNLTDEEYYSYLQDRDGTLEGGRVKMGPGMVWSAYVSVGL